ncbi:MAG TPA: hypothetical protein VF680_11780 [Allosphingosinicella sp.]|jgi:hypothetical protein
MIRTQADLFAQDEAERNELSDARRAAIKERLQARLAQLEATATFPWADPLDAVHEENRFERDTAMLGEEGKVLWLQFDHVMERLHATQSVPDIEAAASTA